jgi:uncharacterized cupredoxin-like copper-binding protein
MIPRTLFLSGVLLALTACSSAGGPAGSMTVVESEFAYTPSEIIVPVGRPFTLELFNRGALEHDLVVDGIEVAEVASSGLEGSDHHHGAATRYDLHVAALPGKTGRLSFTPLVAGTYEIFCSVPGHREAGMVGTLQVVE